MVKSYCSQQQQFNGFLYINNHWALVVSLTVIEEQRNNQWKNEGHFKDISSDSKVELFRFIKILVPCVPICHRPIFQNKLLTWISLNS